MTSQPSGISSCSSSGPDLECAPWQGSVDQAFMSNTHRERPRSTPAYRRGDADFRTAFVLSAPGRREYEMQRPAAGETGTTINKGLQTFHGAEPCMFPSLALDDYTRLNAWDRVEYIACTRRTEATDEEISHADNICRVARLLRNMDVVVAFGVKAQLVVCRAWSTGTLFTGDHPSLQRLNRIYRSDAATRAARREDRTSQWARAVLGTRREMGTSPR